MISAIAVIGQKRELGNKQELLWQVPGDLPRFKKLTMGHPIIMGHKTYESIGRVLPGRTNIVISRQLDLEIEGVEVVPSWEEALMVAGKAEGADEVFVIGGGEIYRLAMPRVDKLYLTVVEATAPADTYFPEYGGFGKVVMDESHEGNGVKYRYLTLER